MVTSVAYSPKSKSVLTGSFDKTVRLWDASSGKQLHIFKGGDIEDIRSVAYSPDGTTILIGSSNNIASLWDATTGKKLLELLGHDDAVTSVAFSPVDNMIATGSFDKTVMLWKRSPYSDQWKKQPESALKLGTEKELHKLMTPTGQQKQ